MRTRLASLSRSRANARGFTMVELLTVMSILVIILGVMAPSFSEFLAAQQAKGLSYDLTGDLMLARNEALKRNASVTVSRGGAELGAGLVGRLGQRRRVAEHAQPGRAVRHGHRRAGDDHLRLQRPRLLADGDGSHHDQQPVEQPLRAARSVGPGSGRPRGVRMSAARRAVPAQRFGAARRAPDRGARRHPDLRLRPARLRRHAGARDLVRIRRLPAQPGAGADRGHGEPHERQPCPQRRVRRGRPDRRRPARRLRRPRRRRARPVRVGQPDPRQRRAARRRGHRRDAVGARLHHASGDEHATATPSSIAWQGILPTAGATSPCGSGDALFPDETLRRAVSSTVCIALLRDAASAPVLPRC